MHCFFIFSYEQYCGNRPILLRHLPTRDALLFLFCVSCLNNSSDRYRCGICRHALLFISLCCFLERPISLRQHSFSACIVSLCFFYLGIVLGNIRFQSVKLFKFNKTEVALMMRYSIAEIRMTQWRRSCKTLCKKKVYWFNFRFKTLVHLQSRLGESTAIFSRFSFPFSPPKVASVSLYPTLRFKVGKTDGIVTVGFSVLQIIKFLSLTWNQLEQTHRVDGEWFIQERQWSY